MAGLREANNALDVDNPSIVSSFKKVAFVV